MHTPVILDLAALIALVRKGIYLEELDEIAILDTLGALIEDFNDEGGYISFIDDNSRIAIIRLYWPSLFDQYRDAFISRRNFLNS